MKGELELEMEQETKNDVWRDLTYWDDQQLSCFQDSLMVLIMVF